MAENAESEFDWLGDGESDPEVKPPTADDGTSDGDRTHPYPPDALFEGRFPISFTTTVALLAVLSAVASIARVGFPDTGIPYNYPLFAGVVYVVAVLFVLRRFHAIFDRTKQDLADVLERTESDKVVFDRERDIDADDLVEQFESTMDWAFSPLAIFLGGLVGGVFTLVVMGALDVFDSYPYIFLNYAYGAGHGFFYGPFIGSIYLVHKVSNDYIIDVDILAPDGVGGYRGVGEAIVDLISYGILLVTLDFVVLSSVSFLDRPLFRTAALAVYGLMLAALLGLTLYGILSLRKGLLDIRERKTDELREQFKAIEASYWRKLDRNESPEPEATHIETMNTMFEQLQSMALWPINLAAAAKLVATTAASLGVAAIETWVTSGELPTIASWLPF